LPDGLLVLLLGFCVVLGAITRLQGHDTTGYRWYTWLPSFLVVLIGMFDMHNIQGRVNTVLTTSAAQYMGFNEPVRSYVSAHVGFGIYLVGIAALIAGAGSVPFGRNRGLRKQRPGPCRSPSHRA
jgi:hypothetical protein